MKVSVDKDEISDALRRAVDEAVSRSVKAVSDAANRGDVLARRFSR